MNTAASEWSAYIDRVNAVETAKATAKKSSENLPRPLDTTPGDMVQYEAKT